MRIVGDSAVGEAFTIDLNYSAPLFNKVRLAFHSFLSDATPFASIEPLAKLAARDFGSKVSLHYPDDVLSYSLFSAN